MEKWLKIWCGILMIPSSIFALLAIMAAGGGGIRGVGVGDDRLSLYLIVIGTVVFLVPVFSTLAMFWPKTAFVLLPLFLIGSAAIFFWMPLGLIYLTLFLVTGALLGATWEEKRETANV